MANLIYVTNVSLDGYIEDEHGSFDWNPPGDDEHAAIREERAIPAGRVQVGDRGLGPLAGERAFRHESADL